jgi:hypothetical protein
VISSRFSYLVLYCRSLQCSLTLSSSLSFSFLLSQSQRSNNVTDSTAQNWMIRTRLAIQVLAIVDVALPIGPPAPPTYVSIAVYAWQPTGRTWERYGKMDVQTQQAKTPDVPRCAQMVRSPTSNPIPPHSLPFHTTSYLLYTNSTQHETTSPT